MTLNINSSASDLVKAITIASGSPFQMEDFTRLIATKQVQPQLLTYLLKPSIGTHPSRAFRFDQTVQTLALPGGKSYTERGPHLQQDVPSDFAFTIPSFGLVYNVAPQDWENRRMPGSTVELQTEGYVANLLTEKVAAAWSLHEELGIAQLLNTDTNLTSGGPFTSYNFYTTLVGSARPAATDMLLGTLVGVDHISNFRKERKILAQDLAAYGLSATSYVAICGDAFFAKRYAIEKQEGLARDLRSTVDLASQDIPTINSGNFLYDNFMGHDGILYVNYGSGIAGADLIADNDAKLIPYGAGDLISMEFAPASTRSYANREALTRYSWSAADEFKGITNMSESNKLFFLKRPKAIRWLTTST